MEFRCYAVIADDPHLKALFREGKDPHFVVAEELAGRLGLVWPNLSAAEKNRLRQRSKSGDFGRLYGRGLESFISGYRLSRKDAEQLIETIDKIFPSIKAYNRWIRGEIHSKGYLESFFGRKRRFGLVIDENKHELYRQGANFLVQSMASDMNLFCMLHLWGLRDKLGIYPLFPVHDSIVLDIPDESVLPVIREEVRAFSKELAGGEMDFEVDMAIGPSWGETKPWRGDGRLG